MTTDGLYTLAELAALLGAPVKRLSRLGSAGRITAHGMRLNRKLYALSEVRAALAPEPANGLLTARQLAAALGRSPNTVAGWIAGGRLRAAGTRRNTGGRAVGAYRLTDGQVLDAAQGREKGQVVRAEPRTLALPPEPTYTAPGSKSRVEVYERRVAEGYSVFHPKDSKLNRSEA